METLNRIVGAVLIAIAAIIAIHTVIEPAYYTSTAAAVYSPVWAYINPLSALAMVLGVIYSYIRSRSFAHESGAAAATWGRLAANTLFYGFVFTGIVFFASWFMLLSPGHTVLAADSAGFLWIIVDALMPVLSGALGITLLRGE